MHITIIAWEHPGSQEYELTLSADDRVTPAKALRILGKLAVAHLGATEAQPDPTTGAVPSPRDVSQPHGRRLAPPEPPTPSPAVGPAAGPAAPAGAPASLPGLPGPVALTPALPTVPPEPGR